MGFFRKIWSYITKLTKIISVYKYGFLAYIIIFCLTISIIMLFGYATGWWGVNLINNLIHGKSSSPIDIKIKFFSNNVIFDKFFSSPKPIKSSTLSFLLTLIIGLGGLLALVLSFKKSNQTERQIQQNQDSELTRFNQTQTQITLTEENNLNTTFKDAVTLLGHENVSVRMGGVYTLIDIAKKTANTNNSYTERVSNILCQHISDRSNIEFYEYLGNFGIPKKDVQFFEDIEKIKKIFTYALYKDNKEELENSFAKISNITNNKYGYYKMLPEALFSIKKLTTDYYSIIQFYLQKYSSSQEIKTILELIIVFEKINLYGSKLSNIKLEIKNLIYFKNCYLNNFELHISYSNNIIDNCFISSASIFLYNKSILNSNNSVIYNSCLNIEDNNIKEFFYCKNSHLLGVIFNTENYKNINIKDSNIFICLFYSKQNKNEEIMRYIKNNNFIPKNIIYDSDSFIEDKSIITIFKILNIPNNKVINSINFESKKNNIELKEIRDKFDIDYRIFFQLFIDSLTKESLNEQTN